MLRFKGHRFEREIILLNVKWYLSYPLSYRNLEEMMQDRGLNIHHSSINRWVLKFSSEIDAKVRQSKGPTCGRWKLDETYIRIGGTWTYLYRAVDNHGDTIDFFLSEKRDKKAALDFLKKAVKWHGIPEKVTIDKSGANKSAIEQLNEDEGTEIEICQSKYKNNIVEQDHRNVKRQMKAALGYKTFQTAATTIAGIEAIAMLRKGQVFEFGTTFAQTFWAMFL